ncbi:hypothetical protein RSOLAG22IIIB_05326 [Rhizoctonia solani]|uniref:Uncharacterized protein n=1 Tax=Rhizoctonia solani TaxID=456999 RepID=A0A0K6G4N9_9AGAM|nr:hypothetical protein RSOLAG22IIIB_05326 [Rhizoctonia solani]
MGNPSSPIYGPGEPSTVLSNVTAVASCAAPPIVPLSSVLDKLVERTREVLAATQRSKSQELMDFGKHANNMVKILVSAVQNNQVAQHSNIRATLDELHKTLCIISSQIVEVNSGGMLSDLRRVVLAEEISVTRMRQQLDDALDLFHFAASINLVMQVPNPPRTSLVITTPNPGRPRVRHPFDSSRVPVCDRPSQETESSRVVEPSRNAPPSTQPESPLALPDNQRAISRHTPITTLPAPNPTPSEIAAACMNVDSQRHLFRHNRSPERTLRLATALERQATLMKNAGRTREALEASQESVELYKTLAERKH